jgi:hypothetical protein
MEDELFVGLHEALESQNYERAWALAKKSMMRELASRFF